MKEQHKDLAPNLKERLTQRTDETYQEATALLDQAVLQTGDEMDSVIIEFQNILSQPEEKQKHSNRLQKQVINELEPKIIELQDDLIKEATQNIEKATKNAQEDLHINQGRLTRDTEETIRMNNEIMKLNIKAMKADIRKEAEILQAELGGRSERQTQHQESNAHQPSPSTPECDTQSM
jgi:hypothetical protein